VRKGFIAGIIIGGLVGVYYGMQLTTRERSALGDLVDRVAAKGRRVMRELADDAVQVVE
jgi:predicted Zn-dependent protease with MMP-like domain